MKPKNPDPCDLPCGTKASPLHRRYFGYIWALICREKQLQEGGAAAQNCADAVKGEPLRLDIPEATPGATETWVTIPGWNPNSHAVSAFIDRTVVPATDGIAVENVVNASAVLIEGSPDQLYPEGLIVYLIPLC